MVYTIGPLAPNIKGRQNSDKCHFLKKYVKYGSLHREWHLSIFQNSDKCHLCVKKLGFEEEVVEEEEEVGALLEPKKSDKCPHLLLK